MIFNKRARSISLFQANGVVTLGESTDFQTVDFHFPDSNECPLNQCHSSFPNRNAALNHFRTDHANTSMQCMHCKVIFPANDALSLLRHYQAEHPNEQAPKLKITSNQPSKNDCDKYNIYCNLCDKSIQSNQPEMFEQHFKKFHPKKMPLEIDQSSDLNLGANSGQKKSMPVC